MAEADGAATVESNTSRRDPCRRYIEIETMAATGEVVDDELTLSDLLRRVAAGIFPADADAKSPSLLRRIRSSLAENVPRLPGACRSTGQELLLWARGGSALRPFLLVSVGTVGTIVLTGLLAFVLFFIAATFNAVVVSFLVSLAAAGGFLAIFFACLTAVYIGALSIALFIISAITISAVVGTLIAAGWIGFLLVVWLIAKKSVLLAKRLLSMTGSALSAYSAPRRTHHRSKKDE